MNLGCSWGVGPTRWGWVYGPHHHHPPLIIGLSPKYIFPCNICPTSNYCFLMGQFAFQRMLYSAVPETFSVCLSVCLQCTARIFLLTKNHVLLADQKSGHIKSEVPLGDVTKVSMSSKNDGFFAVHLKEVGIRSHDTHQFSPLKSSTANILIAGSRAA